MPPPLIGGALSDAFVWRLYVAYIGSKSRTERPRKTKRGSPRHTWLGHHFQGHRSRSPGRFTHRSVGASGRCSGGRGNVLAVRSCCYVAVCLAARGASAPVGKRGAGACRGGRPSTACFDCVYSFNCVYYSTSQCSAQVTVMCTVILILSDFASFVEENNP